MEPAEPLLPPVYRTAHADDAVVLSVLAAQVFLDTYATDGVSADLAHEVKAQYSEAVFRARLARHDAEIVVATQGEYLLAFADLSTGTVCPAADVQGLEVVRLYVQAPFHGRGIGTALMRRAEHRARVQGLPHVWLTAWSGNHRARAFYRHLGYHDAGATDYVIEGKAYENRILVKRLPGDGL